MRELCKARKFLELPSNIDWQFLYFRGIFRLFGENEIIFKNLKIMLDKYLKIVYHTVTNKKEAVGNTDGGDLPQQD